MSRVLALAGGEDGLDAVRTILEQAPRFLNPGGTLVVEVGHNRPGVELAFPRLPLVWLETATDSDSVFLVKREDLIAGRVGPPASDARIATSAARCRCASLRTHDSRRYGRPQFAAAALRRCP